MAIDRMAVLAHHLFQFLFRHREIVLTFEHSPPANDESILRSAHYAVFVLEKILAAFAHPVLLVLSILCAVSNHRDCHRCSYAKRECRGFSLTRHRALLRRLPLPAYELGLCYSAISISLVSIAFASFIILTCVSVILTSGCSKNFLPWLTMYRQL